MGAWERYLRQTLVFLNVAVMAQPEIYIGGAGNLFDDAGRLVKEDTRVFMGTVLEAFANWVRLHRGKEG